MPLEEPELIAVISGVFQGDEVEEHFCCRRGCCCKEGRNRAP